MLVESLILEKLDSLALAPRKSAFKELHNY